MMDSRIEQAIIDLVDVKRRVAQIKLDLRRMLFETYHHGPPERPQCGGVRMHFPFADEEHLIHQNIKYINTSIDELQTFLENFEPPQSDGAKS